MPLRSRRRRLALIQVATLVVLFAAVVWFAHLASYAPRASIQTITVVGSTTLPVHLVTSYVDSELSDADYPFISRRTILLYPRVKIEEGIVGYFPRVRSATVSRATFFSREIIISLEEREPYARWCASLTEDLPCHEMDDRGFIFTAAESISRGARAVPYTFTGGLASTSLSTPIGSTFSPGRLSGLVALLSRIQQETGLIPLQVAVMDEQDFAVTFEQGFVLKAAFGVASSTLARNLTLVLNSDELVGRESELEYIDLRFGNRIFYKLKGDEGESAA